MNSKEWCLFYSYDDGDYHISVMTMTSLQGAIDYILTVTSVKNTTPLLNLTPRVVEPPFSSSSLCSTLNVLNKADSFIKAVTQSPKVSHALVSVLSWVSVLKRAS